MARIARIAVVVSLLHLSMGADPTSTVGSESEQSPDTIPISAEEALRIDAEAYAEMFRTTPEEALRRLELMPSVRAVIDEVVTKHRDRFAGAWFRHTPEFGVFVRLKGDEAANEVEAALSHLAVPLKVVLSASHSLDELLAAQEQVIGLVTAEYRDIATGIDVTTGSIELAGPVGPSPDDLAALAAAVDVPVRHDVTPAARPMHTYGGHEIRNFRGRCTTGFSVQDAVSGRSGILTAGHCEKEVFFGTNPTYVENANSTYPATLGGVRWDRNQDFAWYETSHAELASFWNGSEHRGVVSTQPRLEMVNEFVCHYGIVTRVSCGTVSDIHFAPAASICGGQACDPVWAKVINHGPLLCDEGDSGGPFFVGGVAWGTMTSAATVGPDYGDCAYAVMMTIGALKWDGVNTRVKLIGGGLG